MRWECGEQIETAEVKLENCEEKIPTHAAHEWGTLHPAKLIADIAALCKDPGVRCQWNGRFSN
jgi:hypothetical protein